MRVSSLENYVGNDNTLNSLGYRLTSLETSFPAGCNTIMAAVTAKGVTPTSNSPSDISTAISNIATGVKNETDYNCIYSISIAAGTPSSNSVNLYFEYIFIIKDNKIKHLKFYTYNQTGTDIGTWVSRNNSNDLLPFNRAWYSNGFTLQNKVPIKNYNIVTQIEFNGTSYYKKYDNKSVSEINYYLYHNDCDFYSGFQYCINNNLSAHKTANVTIFAEI